MTPIDKAAALRAAAEHFDDGRMLSPGGAIWWVLGDHPPPVDVVSCINRRFELLFAPREYEQRSYWNDEWGDNARECGVLALCFAAAMAETGDL